jgi:spermidine synthase
VQAQPLKAVHIFSLGCCAICAQSILIRELMPLFTGTEFVVGALLAGWLFWVGAGALLGGRFIANARRASFRRFFALACALAVLLPVTVIGVRFGRGLLARPPGALPPFGAALAFSLVATGPFGFTYGSLYNVASVLAREHGGGLAGGISRVYLWEAGGSFCGALLFSFVLVERFSHFQAAVIAALLPVLTAALSCRRGAARYASGVAVCAVAFAVVSAAPSIDRKSIEFVYRGYRIERFYPSRYGEVVVASQEEVRSVFSGGGRLFSYPEAERTQERIHIPLLMCAEPRAVLLIGISLGGGLEEALKHPSVTRIDCVELDGSLFELDIGDARAAAVRARGGLAPEDGSTRAACDVRFIATDGRFYLSRGSHRYDCIILDSPPAVNLQWNRFYTREFFEIAHRSLNPGGVFAFTHPSSENFRTEEQMKVLGILERTLDRAFVKVSALPGSTVHFVASDTDIDPAVILPRLRERGVDAPFVGENYLPFRFTRERLEELREDLKRVGEGPVNTDARPALPLYELILEGSRQGSRLMAGFGALSRIPAPATAGILSALVLALFAASRKAARARLAVWAFGFAGLLFQFLVLLAYQSFSGLLFRGIVLLTAVFMAGAALGSYVSIRNEEWGKRRLRELHGAFIGLSILLALWSTLLRYMNLPYAAGSAVFLLCAAMGGFLTGSYYPIVVRTAFREDAGAVPAVFYAWDMFGACAGGVTGGLIFFPVLGVAGTALFIALVHMLALLLLAGKW